VPDPEIVTGAPIDFNPSGFDFAAIPLLHFAHVPEFFIMTWLFAPRLACRFARNGRRYCAMLEPVVINCNRETIAVGVPVLAWMLL
jgi:hypothetical protein